MRKLEGVVKEIVDEMDYLKKREERFQSTNSTYERHDSVHCLMTRLTRFSINLQSRSEICVVHHCGSGGLGSLADTPSARFFQAEIPHRLILSLYLLLWVMGSRTGIVCENQSLASDGMHGRFPLMLARPLVLTVTKVSRHMYNGGVGALLSCHPLPGSVKAASNTNSGVGRPARC